MGKLRNYQVKAYTNNSIKPVTVPPRPKPYHLKVRVSDAIDNMLKEGVIEEHLMNDPFWWVSCTVFVPKSDGSIRVTLDTRNANKAIISANQPIPKQEDITTQFTGEIQFSKLDFKSAFWQQMFIWYLMISLLPQKLSTSIIWHFKR